MAARSYAWPSAVSTGSVMIRGHRHGRRSLRSAWPARASACTRPTAWFLITRRAPRSRPPRRLPKQSPGRRRFGELPPRAAVSRSVLVDVARHRPLPTARTSNAIRLREVEALQRRRLGRGAGRPAARATRRQQLSESLLPPPQLPPPLESSGSTRLRVAASMIAAANRIKNEGRRVRKGSKVAQAQVAVERRVAPFPVTLATAVAVDSFVDGFLIGLSAASGTNAGFVMSAALSIEMGFWASPTPPRSPSSRGGSPPWR